MTSRSLRIGTATALALAIGLVAGACSSGGAPSVHPSLTRTTSTSSVGVSNGWKELTSDTHCASNSLTIRSLPKSVQAWTPINRCRALLAGASGLWVASSDGLQHLSPLGGFDQVVAVAKLGEAVWVTGEAASGRPKLEEITATGTSSVFLPAGVTEITALCPSSRGILVAAGSAQKTLLLRTSWLQVKTIRSFAGEPASLAASDGLILLQTHSAGRDLLFASRAGSAWSRTPLPANIDVTGVAASNGVVVAAINHEDVSNVPTAASVWTSTNGGKFWRRSRPANASYIGSIAASGGRLYAALSVPHQQAGVYSSGSAQAWKLLRAVPLSQSGVELDSTNGSVWGLSNELMRLIP
jgi:hypothetical protein